MRFSNIMPAVKEMSIQGETVTIDSNSGINDHSGNPNIGQRCVEELDLSRSKRKSNVTLLRDNDLKSEEYRLDIARKDWKNELSEVTTNTMEIFARPVELGKRLGGNFSRVFGSYLGDELPKYVRAFPYLEHYLASGRPVIGAPAGAEGITTTAW